MWIATLLSGRILCHTARNDGPGGTSRLISSEYKLVLILCKLANVDICQQCHQMVKISQQAADFIQ
jgi:hypothetical protein